MNNIIEIKNLRIDYDEVTAVDDLTLNIPKGQIYGFVGPNGAGKTSTIKALGGVLEPTYGTIFLNGRDLEIEREDALSEVAYMPDFPPVYQNLKTWEYLEVFAAAYGIKEDEGRMGRINEWLNKVGLHDKSESLVKGLSRGMRQRLVLAKILLPEPSILLLDEPASGLDPVARKQMRNILKEVASYGTTIIISSHILSELSDFCDVIGILEKGKLVISGTLDEVRQRMGGVQRVKLSFLDQEKSVEQFWGLVDEWCINRETVLQENGFFFIDFPREDHVASEFLSKLVGSGAELTHFSIQKDDIEDIFFKIGAKEVS